jgi:hypothetical protein
MKYFNHDTSSFDDEKIVELFMKCGYEGLGLFYTILEKLAKQEKPVKTVVLKSQLKVGSRLEKVWKYMEEIGLISENDGETFNEKLLTHSQKYQVRKESSAKRIAEWRKKQIVKENVTHSEQVSNRAKKEEVKPVAPAWAVNFKNYKPGVQYPFELEAFGTIWDLWIQYRREKKVSAYKPIGEQAALKSIAEMSGGNIDNAIKIIDKSIANNWQGLFPLKNQFNGKQDTTDRRSELQRIAAARY